MPPCKQSATSTARRLLRCRLKALAWQALALLRKPLKQSRSVRAADGQHTVRVTVSPAGTATQDSAGPVYQGGQFFSPEEVAVVNVLDHENWLVGKQIAKRCCVHEKGTSRLFIIVSNLCARKVLLKNPEGNGYRLHPEFRRPGLKPAGREGKPS